MPLKVNAPAASTVAVVGPALRITMAPLLSAAGVIVPLIVIGVAVKLTPVTCALLIAISWLAGENV